METNKASDAINSIIKTINPVHPAYSQQNKNYNKYFLSLNLDVINFVKTLNRLYHKKITANSKLYNILYKKNNKNKFVYEEEIQRTLNKLKKMRDNKYIPKTLIDKFKFMEVSEKMRNNEEKINNEMNKKNKNIKIKSSDNFYDEITLDPGRYDPKYNLIFKKIPNVFFKKYSHSNKNNNLNKNKKNINKILFEKKNEKKEKSKSKEKNNTINIKKKKKKKKRIYSTDSIEHKIFSSSMINFKPSKIFTPKFQNYNLNIINLNKLNKTQNSNFYQKFNDLKKKYKIFSANINLKYPKSNEIVNNNEINNRAKSSKNSNANIICFDKMKGRNNNLFDIKMETKNISYNPNYDVITPGFHLKNYDKKEKWQKYKKFMVGKIIRNYHYSSPSEYFIFDANKKKKYDYNSITNDKNFVNKIKYKL